MCRKRRQYNQVIIRKQEGKKNYASCQQKTALLCDTLTTVTYYPLQQLIQTPILPYSALSGNYGNATTGHACTDNAVHTTNVLEHGTPHQKRVIHLRTIYAQQLPHIFPRYLPRKNTSTNYLGRCKCTTN